MKQQEPHLSEQDYRAALHEIRQCWRMLGMLRLRMQNDIDTGKKSRITALGIQEKVTEVRARLDALTREHLGKC